MSRGTPGYLGPYRLLNVVHTGQNCQIWQAYDDGKQTMVGVKTLTEKYRSDREHRAMLRWEFMVGRSVVHPRVLQSYEFAIDRGAPYMVMEWFAAPNLKQRIQQGIDRLRPSLTQIIERSAEALGYFNRCGWVHRDIKPDNFLVADNGDVKLIDFALAVKDRRGILKWFARRPKVQGTRSYISPEQLRGAVLDIRADVYSFGCMVYELFAGRPPFTGSSAQELLNKHLKASPPTIEAADKSVTPEFAQLVRRCLAKDPGLRPQTLEEFLREMKSMKVFKPGK